MSFTGRLEGSGQQFKGEFGPFLVEGAFTLFVSPFATIEARIKNAREGSFAYSGGQIGPEIFHIESASSHPPPVIIEGVFEDPIGDFRVSGYFQLKLK